MKVVSKVVEINNLLTVQLEKNNHELDHIEKNILVHPNIPAPPPPWILNGSPLKYLTLKRNVVTVPHCPIKLCWSPNIMK